MRIAPFKTNNKNTPLPNQTRPNNNKTNNHKTKTPNKKNQIKHLCPSYSNQFQNAFCTSDTFASKEKKKYLPIDLCFPLEHTLNEESHTALSGRTVCLIFKFLMRKHDICVNAFHELPIALNLGCNHACCSKRGFEEQNVPVLHFRPKPFVSFQAFFPDAFLSSTFRNLVCAKLSFLTLWFLYLMYYTL